MLKLMPQILGTISSIIALMFGFKATGNNPEAIICMASFMFSVGISLWCKKYKYKLRITLN